ncbi:MAG TPA: tetratricopeptide repeat protein, partial [Armatimonadota bacterium]|nr:tetratricopeptide repeat protein [Armatimonadota bacterium]
ESLVALAAALPGNIQIRLALSDVYRELGDVRAANVQAWEVLRADPDSIEARRRLALAAENLGDFEGAIGHLKAIRVIDATNTYYLSPMGRLLAAQGHLAEAIREYELLLERDPESLLIQFDLATLYIKARDTKRAQPLLLAYLSERPQAVWALDQLARCAELEGDFEQALELRRKVALLSPDDRGALDRLVKLYERQGQAHLATDYLVTLMSVPHPPPTAVRVFVHTYRRHSGARAALEQIRGLADIFRHRPVFQQVAAETCAQERLSDEAIVRYAHYLHYQPDDYGAVSQLIALSREAGDMDRCRPLLTRYVERNPGNGPALIALTRISLEVGKPMDAYAAVCTALEADSGGATCHRLLAEVLARLYGTSKAVEVMATRAEASYEPGPRIGLAYAHVLNGAPGEATAVLTAAAESEMTAADAAYVSGLAKNGLGLHKGAVADLARAAAGIDAPPDFRIALARAIDLRTAGIGAMGVRATTRRPGVGG